MKLPGFLANGLIPLVTAAGAVWIGWMATGRLLPGSAGKASAISSRLTIAAGGTSAKSADPADSALRRLANFQLPSGRDMDLGAILALHPRHSPHPALDRAVEECLLTEFVERDPRAALAAALRGAPGHTVSELATRVLQVWMKLDFDG